MKESPSNNNEHQDPAISPSPIKTSTFLDNLPLSVSVDSDPIVPLTPDLKPVASDPDPISKLQKTDSSSSKDSFDFVPLTQDSPKKPQKSKPLQSKSSKSNLLQISKEDAKQEDPLQAHTQYLYKLEDSSTFTITIVEPPSSPLNKWQEPKQVIKNEESSQKLLLDQDQILVHDLKSYRPKVPRKTTPWTMFGAGLAAIVVFFIILIKLRRALRR
jgi:hypothetical protein